LPSCAREQTHELRQAYRLLFSDENTLKERIGDVENPFPANPLVKRLIEFLNADTEQSFLVPDYAATRSAGTQPFRGGFLDFFRTD
jgi:UDP-N-acetylglucosamine acyltransferase